MTFPGVKLFPFAPGAVRLTILVTNLSCMQQSTLSVSLLRGKFRQLTFLPPSRCCLNTPIMSPCTTNERSSLYPTASALFFDLFFAPIGVYFEGRFGAARSSSVRSSFLHIRAGGSVSICQQGNVPESDSASLSASA